MSHHESFWSDLRAGTFAQGYLDADGIRTRYLHAGSAELPPLLLLHGVGGHAETYTRNLLEHGEHFNTYAIDMVGHGFSAKPDYDYEVDVYVEHVRAVIDALGFERIFLSGESLGGWVTARFALKYPERLERIVLNTCGGATLNPDVMQRIKTLTMAAVNEPDRDTVKARLEWLMADPASVTDDLIACRQAIYRQPDMPGAMARIMCLQETEIRRRNNLSDDEWAAITAETLVLWTDKDPTAAANVGEKIARLIPNARFALMSNCGHWPQFEDPSTFNTLHLNFCSRASEADMSVTALCASHTPLRDYCSPGAAIEQELAAVFTELRDWTRAGAPDLLVVIGPDHFNGFFYRLMPSFCVGALARGVGDWQTRRGPLPTEPALAEHCVQALQRGGSDPALSFDMVVDHGCTQIIEQLFDWSSCPPVLPVFINCAAPPLPPLPRVDAFGTALGHFLAGLDRNVLVIGSGGLSHDPPIPVLHDAPPAVRERLIQGGDLSVAARNERQQRVLDDARRQTAGTSDRTPLNPDWDERFLADLIADQRPRLLGLDDAAISAEAGAGGHEIRTWIAAAACARAAQVTDAKVHYYRAIPEWVAGYGIATFR